jgi:ABC-type sugar transport system ATPase subunit
MRLETLRLESVFKTFPGVIALNNVNINAFKGEILGLIGENGSGKSTLIKIAAGIHTMDSGRIFINGKKVQIHSPLDAKKLGISVIHQEPVYFPNLSLMENIFLYKEKRQGLLFLDRKSMDKSAKELLNRVGLNISASTLAGDLTCAQKQQLEIAKSLLLNASLIIMDEPTASLTDREIEILKEIIVNLKKDGLTIIFVSHKLNEVLAIADRIAVLRDGVSIGTYEKNECDEAKLIRLMVGQEPKPELQKESLPLTEEIMRIENLSTKGFLQNISFKLCRGEIIGITGLLGSGRSELLNTIFGVTQKLSGDIYIKGIKTNIRNPINAIKNKISFLPEDRKNQALIFNMSVKENITLIALKKLSLKHIINPRLQRFLARYYSERFYIKPNNIEFKVRNLSGGNQQKVVIVKWLSVNSEILMLDEPTKGIDIESKKEVRNIIRQLAAEGKGIIIVTSDMNELALLCDKVLILNKGTIKAEIPGAEIKGDKILSMMGNSNCTN